MVKKTIHRIKKPDYKLSMHKAVRLLAKTSLPEIMFVSTLIFGRYLNNADFSYPSEIILPIPLFAAIVTAFFYLYRYILRHDFAAHVAAVLLAYGSYSYSYLPHWIADFSKLLLPHSLETSFSVSLATTACLGVVAGLIGWGLQLLTKKVIFVRHMQPYKILLFVISFLFVTQVFKVGARLVSIHKELSYKAPSTTMPARDAGATVKKPDIYYFVYDRYGNNETLKNNFGYDNSQLTDTLSKQGFVTNTDAYANYPFTMGSITSTLAMGYHTDFEKQFGKDKLQTAFPYRTIFNDPPVAQVLKQNGYSYNQVSSWWDFTRVGIQADTNPTESFRLRILGKSFYLSDLTRDIVNKSILSPWLKKGLSSGRSTVIKYDQDNNPRQNFFAQIDAVKKIASQPNTQPQFTFAHFLAPHDPYIFDADGSDPAYDGNGNDVGLDETQKYTNQIIYLNAQIEATMAYIRQHSPNAVIIIQSDEGPYPKDFRFAQTPQHYYDPINLAPAQIKQKYGVLASYYMPGIDPQTVSSQLDTSVNAFRFVLKNYLGYSIDMLPACSFSTGNKFVVYDYTQVTDKLTGKPAPAACENY